MDAASLIREDHVFLDFEADSFDDLVDKMSSKLAAEGYVKETYAKGLKDREKIYPTGLETLGMPVAVPHTDREHVIKSIISVIHLKKPIRFTHMATTDQFVDAEMVFMLAIKEDNDQLTVLKQFMNVFCDEPTLISLREAKSETEIVKILRDFIQSKEVN